MCSVSSRKGSVPALTREADSSDAPLGSGNGSTQTLPCCAARALGHSSSLHLLAEQERETLPGNKTEQQDERCYSSTHHCSMSLEWRGHKRPDCRIGERCRQQLASGKSSVGRGAENLGAQQSMATCLGVTGGQECCANKCCPVARMP